jgi:hypothetical protein
MILPILRLVLIYFLLVAGVVAVFNRDKLAPLFGGGRDQAEAAAPAEPAEIPSTGTKGATDTSTVAPAPEGDTSRGRCR